MKRRDERNKNIIRKAHVQRSLHGHRWNSWVWLWTSRKIFHTEAREKTPVTTWTMLRLDQQPVAVHRTRLLNILHPVQSESSHSCSLIGDYIQTFCCFKSKNNLGLLESLTHNFILQWKVHFCYFIDSLCFSYKHTSTFSHLKSAFLFGAIVTRRHSCWFKRSSSFDYAASSWNNVSICTNWLVLCLKVMY